MNVDFIGEWARKKHLRPTWTHEKSSLQNVLKLVNLMKIAHKI